MAKADPGKTISEQMQEPVDKLLDGNGDPADKRDEFFDTLNEVVNKALSEWVTKPSHIVSQHPDGLIL